MNCKNIAFICVLLKLFLFTHLSYANCVINLSQLASKVGLDPNLISVSNLESPECNNVATGKDYVSFILNNSNLKINNGIRSELAIGYPFVEGDVIQYRWSMLLPSNAPPGGDYDNWWVVAQWHDQPDPNQGETWSNFKSLPPPVAIFVEKRSGSVGVGLQREFGKKVMWGKVPLDEWLDVTVSIKWSTTSTGYADVYVKSSSGTNLNFSFMGRTMNNHYQHYFKVGQYRHPAYNFHSEVFVKNLSFSKLFDK